jgi:hypothetical protein
MTLAPVLKSMKRLLAQHWRTDIPNFTVDLVRFERHRMRDWRKQISSTDPNLADAAFRS